MTTYRLFGIGIALLVCACESGAAARWTTDTAVPDAATPAWAPETAPESPPRGDGGAPEPEQEPALPVNAPPPEPELDGGAPPAPRAEPENVPEVEGDAGALTAQLPEEEPQETEQDAGAPSVEPEDPEPETDSGASSEPLSCEEECLLTRPDEDLCRRRCVKDAYEPGSCEYFCAEAGFECGSEPLEDPFCLEECQQITADMPESAGFLECLSGLAPQDRTDFYGCDMGESGAGERIWFRFAECQ